MSRAPPIFDEVSVLLRTSQVTLRSALFMHMALLLIWSTATIVTGFGKYDAVPASFNAISHTGFWLAWEILVVCIGLMSISFDMSTYKEGLILSLIRTRKFVTFWCVLLCIAVAANIVHIVACGIELKYCKSTLCLLNSGFLIGLIVWLAIILFIEAMEIYCSYIYKRRMAKAKHALTLKTE